MTGGVPLKRWCLHGHHVVCLEDVGDGIKVVIDVKTDRNPVLVSAVSRLVRLKGPGFVLGLIHDFIDYALQWLARSL